MKLFLMRHADKKYSENLDEKTPLSEDGKKKTICMAGIIKRELKEEKIDRILSSPYSHAKETAELIKHSLGLPEEVKVEEEKSLLDPSSSQLKNILKKCNKKVILLIGHNPQITEFIRVLSGKKVTLHRAGVCCINVNNLSQGDNPVQWTRNYSENDIRTCSIELLQLDYKTTNDYFRQLSEIRFKLLAFVPLVSGSAVGLLTLNDKDQSAHPEGAFLLGLFGLFVTLGVVFYELRNSQFYDLAVCRAKKLERQLKMPLGGLFNGRPKHTNGPKIFGLTVWHDRGLALIYGTTLAGWSYLIIHSFLQILKNNTPFLVVPIIVALFMLIISVIEFARLEKDREQNGGGEDS
ncbi:MAG: histidine phosphatase family protein [Methanothrix sp.]|nr:histidine phosphatase family protein [Methanothrix sp.]